MVNDYKGIVVRSIFSTKHGEAIRVTPNHIMFASVPDLKGPD